MNEDNKKGGNYKNSSCKHICKWNKSIHLLKTNIIYDNGMALKLNNMLHMRRTQKKLTLIQ